VVFIIFEKDQENREDMEKYVKAIEASLFKVPVREGDSIYLSDIWLVTSLPKDLIVEILKNYPIEMPENVKIIVDGKKVIKRR
jgi:hypothetical protein